MSSKENEMRRREFLVAGSTAAALVMTTNAPILVNASSEFLDDQKLMPPEHVGHSVERFQGA
jgi:hypothetical protein